MLLRSSQSSVIQARYVFRVLNIFICCMYIKVIKVYVICQRSIIFHVVCLQSEIFSMPTSTNVKLNLHNVPR